MYSSSDVIYEVSISWKYILLSVNDNFSVRRKLAKIVRDDIKTLRVKMDFTFGLVNKEFIITQKDFAVIGIQDVLFILRVEKESQLCL